MFGFQSLSSPAMGKAVILAVLALALAIPLSAGGADELVTDRPVDLVVAFWGDSMKHEALQMAADTYTQQYPNVTIRLNRIPGGEYNTRISSMIEAGGPLDVININNSLYYDLRERLLDLTSNMEEDGYFDNSNGLFQGWFHMLAEDGHYEDGDSLFQAPLNSGTTVLAYNKRLFDEAGIDYPNADWKWEEEFLNAATRLSAPERNQWGINGVNYGYVHHAIVAAYGGQLFDFTTDQNPPKFRGNEQRAVEALEFLQDLIYKYGVAPTPAQQDQFGGSGVGMFENRRAAMYFLNTFEFPKLYKFEDEWDIVPLPRGPDGKSATTIYGQRLAVLESSSNSDHAWEFIHLLNSKAGQDAFDTYFGFSDPALQSVANDYIFADGWVGAPEHNRYRFDVLKDQTAMINPTISDNPVFDRLDKQLELLWKGEITTVQEAMDSIAK